MALDYATPVGDLPARMTVMEANGVDYAAFKVAMQAAVAALQAGTLSGVYQVQSGGANPLPDPAANLGKYAVVDDLFGDKLDKVLASKSGSFSYWQPVRPTYAAPLTLTSDLTVHALRQPSTLRITSNIAAGVTRQITMDTTYAWPGEQKEIAMGGTIGALGALNIAGAGAAVALLAGGYKKFVCEFVSGALQYRQVV